MLVARDPITGPSHAATTCRGVLAELALLLVSCLRSRAALAAESLFLRKQLALFEERKAQPHRATDAVRFVMSAPGRLFDWHHALRVAEPDTFIRRASQRISIVLGGGPDRSAGPSWRAACGNSSAPRLLKTRSGAKPVSPTNSGITSTAAQIAVSGREFQRHSQRLRRLLQTATKYLMTPECWRSQSWEDYITNTRCKKWWRCTRRDDSPTSTPFLRC
jgi:hypothetical protein